MMKTTNKEMNLVFNGQIELFLRGMILLNRIDKDLSIDRICMYDLLAIYNKDFNIGEYNLHGENALTFGEYTSKRDGFTEALKIGIYRGYVVVNPSTTGLAYQISSSGKSFINSLDLKYKDHYIECLNNAYLFGCRRTDSALLTYITNCSNRNLLCVDLF